jgi:pimeloyl-ACP methyl ester carboxylesterase
MMGPFRQIEAGVLSVGVHDDGPVDGPVAILLHGFPYDVHAYREVRHLLLDGGCRVIVPYLRGYGPTRFLHADTPRSGEQAALGSDLLALMDALEIESAVLAGYDWGGRAACVVAAQWPGRCTGLVSCNGYNLLDPRSAVTPASPENEWRYWYQYYLHGERGRRGLAAYRREFARLLWQSWSPQWRFSDEDFDASAKAFDNPDFVEVVVHSYRHRHGLAPGDPAYAALEAALLARPTITPPTILLDGLADGVALTPDTRDHASHFANLRAHRGVTGIGHNVPQECPAVFAEAVLALIER